MYNLTYNISSEDKTMKGQIREEKIESRILRSVPANINTTMWKEKTSCPEMKRLSSLLAASYVASEWIRKLPCEEGIEVGGGD